MWLLDKAAALGHLPVHMSSTFSIEVLFGVIPGLNDMTEMYAPAGLETTAGAYIYVLPFNPVLAVNNTSMLNGLCCVCMEDDNEHHLLHHCSKRIRRLWTVHCLAFLCYLRMFCPAGSYDRTGIALSATWPRLRFAFAGCLQSALSHQGSETLDKEDPQSPQPELGTALPMDTRAVLILELLLAGLTGPAPSLTHLLMGFDVTQGPDGTPLVHVAPLNHR